MFFYYKIAGLTVKMESFGRTVAQAIPYQIPPVEKPDIILQPDFLDLQPRFPRLSEADCEYLSSGRYFYYQLLHFDGMMLHSSAIAMDGRAYLFTADPGMGKSTHTSLWRCVFGDERVHILNDDKPALRFEDGAWYTYGTPWCGKTAQNLNLRVPLGGIAILGRGEENEIQRCAGREAISALFRQTSNPKDPMLRTRILELLDKLISNVPVWKLCCNMEPEAAIVAYEAMSGQKWRK